MPTETSTLLKPLRVITTDNLTLFVKSEPDGERIEQFSIHQTLD